LYIIGERKVEMKSFFLLALSVVAVFLFGAVYYRMVKSLARSLFNVMTEDRNPVKEGGDNWPMEAMDNLSDVSSHRLSYRGKGRHKELSGPAYDKGTEVFYVGSES